MNHKYKLSDFKRITMKTATDIQQRTITVDLSYMEELPEIIVLRLESIVNRAIAKYEEENNTTVILEDIKLGIYISLDTAKWELFLEVFASYPSSIDDIDGEEIIAVTDKNYSFIKEFFFKELNHYLFEQVKRIQGCVA